MKGWVVGRRVLGEEKAERGAKGRCWEVYIAILDIHTYRTQLCNLRLAKKKNNNNTIGLTEMCIGYPSKTSTCHCINIIT